MSFTKALEDFKVKFDGNCDNVYGRSVELLGEEMARTIPEGGRVPVDTGELARSILASKEAMPNTSDGPFSGSNVGLVAATLKATEYVFIGYQAKYARRMNYGFVGADSLGRVYNQSGHYFVEAAVANWQNIVNQAVSELT